MENQAAKNWEPIDFTVYFSFIKWWTLLLMGLEIIFHIWADQSGGGFFYSQQELLAWLMRIIIFSLLGWRVVVNFGHALMVGVISGACAGLAVGVAVAIFRFLSGVQLWKIFNLITESALSTVVGAAVVLLVILIFSFKNN